LVFEVFYVRHERRAVFVVFEVVDDVGVDFAVEQVGEGVLGEGDVGVREEVGEGQVVVYFVERQGQIVFVDLLVG
jgi:hypothetical protein